MIASLVHLYFHPYLISHCHCYPRDYSLTDHLFHSPGLCIHEKNVHICVNQDQKFWNVSDANRRTMDDVTWYNENGTDTDDVLSSKSVRKTRFNITVRDRMRPDDIMKNKTGGVKEQLLSNHRTSPTPIWKSGCWWRKVHRTSRVRRAIQTTSAGKAIHHLSTNFFMGVVEILKKCSCSCSYQESSHRNKVCSPWGIRILGILSYIKILKTNIGKRTITSLPASPLPKFGRNQFRAGRLTVTALREFTN